MNHNQTDDSTDTDHTTRRSALKALGGLAALGAVPGAVTAEEEPSENSDGPEFTDEQIERLKQKRHPRCDHRIHAYVDVPPDVWADAVERAQSANEPERLEAYLLDYFLLEFGFMVDGQVVHEPEGFDPEKVVVPAAPDGEVLARVPPHPDEGKAGE